MIDKGFELADTQYGTDLVVTGDWSNRARSKILAGRADGLVLNYALGFRERDLNFITGLPIKRLKILARTHRELDPIYSLSETLEELHLQTGPSAIDLSRLPKIVRLSAVWAQIAETIDSLPMLDDLMILSFKEPDLRKLQWNSKLRRLRTRDRPSVEVLDGIEELAMLEELDLSLSRVSDLSPLAAAPALSRLEFQSCRRLGDISALATLPALEQINFSECGEILTVGALRGLIKLELIQLWGSTNVMDGDLSPIASLPELSILRMNPRKHYNPSVQSIKEAIGDF